MYYTVDSYVERDGRESIEPSHVICSDKQEVDILIARLVDFDVNYANVAYGGKFIPKLTDEGSGNCTWKKLVLVNPDTTEILYTVKYMTHRLWPLELEEADNHKE